MRHVRSAQQQASKCYHVFTYATITCLRGFLAVITKILCFCDTSESKDKLSKNISRLSNNGIVMAGALQADRVALEMIGFEGSM